MKFSRKKVKSNTDEDEGILYVLLIKLEEKDLVKIGITKRDKVEDRVAEIVKGIFVKYRYFPYVYVKRFRKTSEVFEKEATMHQYFKDKQYKTKFKFGGSTEMFEVDLDEVVDKYEELLDTGEIKDETKSKLEEHSGD